MKTSVVTYLDVAEESLDVALAAVQGRLGPDVEVPDDLDDSAMDSAVFELWCAVRIARSSLARVRLLEMMLAEPLPRPKKSKKAKR